MYREFSEGEDRYLGSAAVQVQDSFTEEQLEQMFRDALYAAGFSTSCPAVHCTTNSPSTLLFR